MASSKKKQSKVKKKTAAKRPSKKSTSKKKTVAKKSTAKKTTRKKSTARKKRSTTKKKTSATKSRPKAKSESKKKKKTAAKKSTAKKKSTATKTKKKTSKKTTTAKKSSTSKKKSTAAKTKKKTSKKTTASKVSSKKKVSGKKKLGGKSRSKQNAAPAEPPKPDANGYMVINGRRVRVIASKEGAVKKKPKPAVPAPDKEAEKQRLKSIKTSLSKKELNHFRALLLLKRAELVGDLNSIETEALRSSDGDISHMPIHMADVGSDTYEQDFMLGLAENDRTLLREIDEALQRIEDRTFGVCQLTGNMIGAARLEAKPWAKYSIEAKRMLESGQAS